MGIPAIHPGEHLTEELKELDIGAAELARQLQLPTAEVTDILNGKRRVTGDTTLRLAHYFGTSPEFWMNLQKLYELRIAAEKVGDSIDSLPTLRNDLAIDVAERSTALEPVDSSSDLRNCMITSIRMVNFKNFANETLRLGPFTVIVGSNASGKSNIRDAFRFLHGIGRGYSLAEIVGGKWGAGGQQEWQPIRGAAKEIVRLDSEPSDQVSLFSFEVDIKVGDEPVSYLIEIGFNSHRGRYSVVDESVLLQSRAIYNTDLGDGASRVYINDESGLFSNSQEFNPEKPILTQFHVPNEPILQNVSHALASMRFWDLSPELMRSPAQPGTSLGDRGENLPAVLEDLYADPKLRLTLVSWLQELTPMDVSDFEFPHDLSGLVHLILCERNGRKVSADSASDGTLRFLALLAVLLGKNPPKLCFFEEIDTGIHSARQWLLLKLTETQAAKRGIQIVTTTHSPEILTYANDDTFEHLSVVGRIEDAHDAVIRPVAGLYDARDLRKSGELLGSLLSEGWMENAISFAEHDDDDDQERRP